MRSGPFVLAALLCAQPALAQDPLAPILEQPKPSSASTAPLVVVPPPSTTQPAIPAPPPIPIPRDWREVFAAIRNGQWASAEAGIAVLPNHVLSPVAKAELYIAKGSPVVDLPRLQALLAEAPELPQAEQIARMALTRGATTSPLVVPKRPLTTLRGPVPRAAGRQAACPAHGPGRQWR